MNDPFARKLAAASLCASLLALVLAGYSAWQGATYREDVRALGQALVGLRPTTDRLPDRSPRPALDLRDP